MKPGSLHIVACCLLALASCAKDEDVRYESRGEILEQDLRKCSLCGGYFVRIDNSSKEYRTFGLPAGSGIDLKTEAKPIPVYLSWHADTGALGSAGVIIIDAIRRR